MKELLAVGNWKMHKTSAETVSYLGEIRELLAGLDHSAITIIICPPYLSVPAAAKFIEENKLPISLGVQDVAPFEDGEYTGEVSANLAAEFAKYVIIGHSERRENFKEDDDMLSKKVSSAISAGLIPIFCVQNEDTFIPEGVKIVAYEPPFAINSDNPDTPENAERVTVVIKSKNQGVAQVLYGGSVNLQNVASFTTMPNISGILVGRASRDPASFASLIKQC